LKVDNFSAGREITHFVEPKIHHRVQKSSKLEPNLSQFNPVQPLHTFFSDQF